MCLKSDFRMLDPKDILLKYKEFIECNPKYKAWVNVDYLPFERYEVYERWKPGCVKVLFIAESPPWIECVYFYNEHYEGELDSEVFKLLKLNDDNKSARLKDFKKSFFLIDMVKCVFHKNIKKSIPNKLIRYSAQEIVQDEIECLKPKIIFGLGSTALKGLKTMQRFKSQLSRFTCITEACGKSVKIDDITIGFSIFPSNQNRVYENRIKSAFTLIEKLDC